LPVLIHAGPSLSMLKNDFADPNLYIPVIKRYPKINFILAHMGHQLERYGIESLLDLPNVFFDITGFQNLNFSQPESVSALKTIFDDRVSAKILYGSDWPLFNLTKSLNDHIGILKKTFEEMAHTTFVKNNFEQI